MSDIFIVFSALLFTALVFFLTLNVVLMIFFLTMEIINVRGLPSIIQIDGRSPFSWYLNKIKLRRISEKWNSKFQ